MVLINCAKHNDTHLVCKETHTVSQCLDTNNSITRVESHQAIKFPDTIWTIPIIISIIIASGIIILIVGNVFIRLYVNRAKIKE